MDAFEAAGADISQQMIEYSGQDEGALNAFNSMLSCIGAQEQAASDETLIISYDEDSNTYTFSTRGGSGTSEYLARSASNKEDGSITFGSFAFTEADDGIETLYRIAERNEAKPGYSYDENVFYARITPHDNGDGTMSFDISYENENGDVLEGTQVYVFADGFEIEKEEYEALDEVRQLMLAVLHKGADALIPEAPVLASRQPATFRNEYHASGSVQLYAWKQLIGRGLQENEFEFELLARNPLTGLYAPVQTKKNDADGTVAFDPISCTEKDVGRTFFFFAREKAGTDDSVVYSGAVFGYRVTVIDNGDGTLSFTQKHIGVTMPEEGAAGVAADQYIPGEETAELPLFVNTLKSGTVTAAKYTTWLEGDEPDPDTEFRFRIRLTDPEGRAVEDGNMEFSLEQVENIGAHAAGAPAGGRSRAASPAPTAEKAADTTEKTQVPAEGEDSGHKKEDEEKAAGSQEAALPDAAQDTEPEGNGTAGAQEQQATEPGQDPDPSAGEKTSGP